MHETVLRQRETRMLQEVPFLKRVPLQRSLLAQTETPQRKTNTIPSNTQHFLAAFKYFREGFTNIQHVNTGDSLKSLKHTQIFRTTFTDGDMPPRIAGGCLFRSLRSLNRLKPENKCAICCLRISLDTV